MKILFLTRCFYPAVEYGGPIFVMKSLAQGLAARGHEVTVWTTDVLNLSSRMEDTPKTEELFGARVVYFKSGPGYRWDRLARGLGRSCAGIQEFDAIHIFGYRDFLSPTVCHHAARKRIPYIVEPLGSFLPHLRSFKKKWLYDHTVGVPIMRHASSVIASSEMEKDDIVAQGIDPARVQLRLNGIDLQELETLPPRGALRERLGIDENAPVILFLGRINPKKGLDRLLPAMVGLKQPDVHLIVVGPTEDQIYLDRTRKNVSSLDLRARVHFTGPLYNEDKLQAMADADVFVLPSDKENYGVAAAEAIACGVPVVVTETCGIASYIPSGAGLIVPTDSIALAEALRQIACDPAERARMSAICKSMRGEFSWGPVLDVQEKIYQSVMAPVGEVAIYES